MMSTALLTPAAYALVCPLHPQQYNRDWDIEIQTAVGKLGKASVAELEIRARSATVNLLAKLPDADVTYIRQMMYATYCSAVRDDKALTEAERAARIETHNREVGAALDGRKNPNAGPRPSTSTTGAREAREALDRKGVPYTPAAFVDSVAQRKTEVAKLYIQAGVDVSAIDATRVTALMRASHNGDRDLVDALLKAGADINQRERDRFPAIVWASSNGQLDVVRQLLRHRRPPPDNQSLEDAVLRAADFGRPEALDLLLNRAAEPRTLASQAVSRAIMGGLGRVDEAQMVAVIQLLVRRGADVNLMDSYGGWTPLTQAIRGQHVNVAKLLLASGARLDTRCGCDWADGGNTPLAVAAHNAPSMIPMLLQAGADLHARNELGQTPLLVAAFNNQPTAVLGLLAAGANPNDQDPNGNTALTAAAVDGYADVIERLLAAGADPNVRTRKGSTPLTLAAVYGGVAATQRLLEGGARPDLRDGDGKTALELAESQFKGKGEARTAMLKLLREARPQ